jgi:antitoxin component of MazEF toxin-antitoxin module
MGVATLRAKNQVTLPAKLLAEQGFREGDALTFEAASGGIIVRRSTGTAAKRTAFDVFAELADAVPGLADVEFEVHRSKDTVRVANL